MMEIEIILGPKSSDDSYIDYSNFNGREIVQLKGSMDYHSFLEYVEKCKIIKAYF